MQYPLFLYYLQYSRPFLFCKESGDRLPSVSVNRKVEDTKMIKAVDDFNQTYCSGEAVFLPESLSPAAVRHALSKRSR